MPRVSIVGVTKKIRSKVYVINAQAILSLMRFAKLFCDAAAPRCIALAIALSLNCLSNCETVTNASQSQRGLTKLCAFWTLGNTKNLVIL